MQHSGATVKGNVLLKPATDPRDCKRADVGGDMGIKH